jgi:WD40 repeat protein
MRSQLAGLSLIVALTVVATALAPTEQPTRTVKELSVAGRPPHTDAYGDPLPPGALARIGTERFRHGNTVRCVAFSPDGKILAAVGYDGIRLWNAQTGTQVRAFLEHVSPFASAVFSPDGRRLWLWREGQPRVDGSLWRWDLGEDADSKPKPAPFLAGIRPAFALSPDGKLLAASHQDVVKLWDVATGTELQVLGGQGLVRQLRFSRSGKVVGALGIDGQILLWDVASGKQLESPLGAGLAKGLRDFVITGDGPTVVAIGDDNGIFIHRFGGAADDKVALLQGTGPSPHELALSADGRTLAVAFQTVFHVWDVASGRAVCDCPIKSSYGFLCASFSPDGKTLAAGFSFQVRLWDIPAGKERLPGPDAAENLRLVRLLSDGRTVATAAEGKPWRFWEARTGKEMLRAAGRPRLVVPYIAALSPDGEIMFTIGDDNAIRLLDLRSGRELHRFPGQRRVAEWYFSPDGRILLVHSRDPLARRDKQNTLQMWDVRTGREVGHLEGPEGEFLWSAISPDSKLLAFARFDRTVRLLEVASLQELWAQSFKADTMWRLGFSPDGRLLCAAGRGEQPLRLWEVETGKELAVLSTEKVREKHRHDALGMVFSPDGRRLITGDNFGMLYCWDLTSGRLLHEWQAHKSCVMYLALSANGRTLVTHAQTNALVWDLRELLPDARPPNTALTTTQWQALWADLRDADATRAYRAVWSLADTGNQVVPLLREQLRPAREPDARNRQRIIRLVANLDNDSFSIRESATCELEALGKEAEPELRQLLAGSPAPEARKRAEELLQKMSRSHAPLRSPERLRELRAIAVMEYVGTAEARRVLQDLAGGSPGARLTREAKAALGRLASRLVNTP